MMNMLFNLVANYNRVIMEENSDNLKMNIKKELKDLGKLKKNSDINFLAY